mmetsp:Transcript_30806/g.44832  ORF Transcript_30806/g.44832 Transcript_30806/m.44832 type:complete len:286 (+) Transcript_30806:115-972(+)
MCDLNDKKEPQRQETQETFPDSPSDDEASLPDEAIIYTEEELQAMRDVRAKLTEEHGIEESRIGSIFLAVTTINCKLRVDETVKKIAKLLGIMAKLGCEDGIDDELWKPAAAHELKPYAPAGKDHNGCRTTWIRGGGKVSKEEERNHCHACIMQHLATHADAKTLRNGISFIIDVSGKDMEKEPKVGNETLIQSFHQAIPQRPQVILIAGTSRVTRAFVNASIKLASLFLKQKILDRITFVSVEVAKKRLPLKSAPVYVGGNGGGIENYQEWVKGRLEMLQMPDL